ncbi:hypothetical protein QFC20_000323 [Naganishia adeliensis]|uniref:Uncharacterized protein n=1 Tax=Naganishia adeliensis TaxID=92952 RepID=A0ACC2X1A7_9TREE|nr:hypothetical protein QFC20_000323 [Naganishia adeliensis]
MSISILLYPAATSAEKKAGKRLTTLHIDCAVHLPGSLLRFAPNGKANLASGSRAGEVKRNSKSPLSHTILQTCLHFSPKFNQPINLE